jgi:hypothetical protein
VGHWQRCFCFGARLFYHPPPKNTVLLTIVYTLYPIVMALFWCFTIFQGSGLGWWQKWPSPHLHMTRKDETQTPVPVLPHIIPPLTFGRTCLFRVPPVFLYTHMDKDWLEETVNFPRPGAMTSMGLGKAA